MIKAKSFKDLLVWQKSHELAIEIYKVTKNFPAEEKFALVSQMRRAAVSVAANIAEGFKRRGIKDKVNFYNISQASLDELDYYLILAKDLKYCASLEKIVLLKEYIAKMLNALISAINNENIP